MKINITKAQYHQLIKATALANATLGRLGDVSKESDYKPQSNELNEFEDRMLLSDFEIFWELYPRKENKLDNLLEMRLSGEVESDLFAQKKADLTTQQDEIMKQIQKINDKNTDWVEKADNCLNLANRAKRAWKSGSKQLKREILKSLSSNAYLVDGKIELELRKPFDTLLIPRFDTSAKKAHNGLSSHKFSNWLPRSDSNRRPIG